MSYIKLMIDTVDQIMNSPKGGLVLAYEVGQLRPVEMRQYFSREQLEILQYMRREENPTQWERVFEPAAPEWITYQGEKFALGLVVGVDRQHKTSGFGIQLGKMTVQLHIPLENQGALLDANLSALQRLVVTLNGGAILYEHELLIPPQAEIYRVAAETGTDPTQLVPIKRVTVLAFATSEGRDHCLFLLGGAEASPQERFLSQASVKQQYGL